MTPNRLLCAVALLLIASIYSVEFIDAEEPSAVQTAAKFAPPDPDDEPETRLA